MIELAGDGVPPWATLCWDEDGCCAALSTPADPNWCGRGRGLAKASTYSLSVPLTPTQKEDEMQDFLHRTVSDSVQFIDREGSKTTVMATHMRTSSGAAGITLYVNGKQALDLNSDLEDYQAAALAIADLLKRMADEPCTLPQVG